MQGDQITSHQDVTNEPRGGRSGRLSFESSGETVPLSPCPYGAVSHGFGGGGMSDCEPHQARVSQCSVVLMLKRVFRIKNQSITPSIYEWWLWAERNNLKQHRDASSYDQQWGKGGYN